MRNSWVDYAKGIGIILVVYGHAGRGLAGAGLVTNQSMHQLVESIIYSFHMPLFFFLSGLFFKDSLAKRSGPQLIANKCDTVAYPYLVWALLQSLLAIFGSRWTNGTADFSALPECLWRPGGQFWFLYSLFFMIVIAVLIFRRISTLHILLVAAGASLLHFVPSPFPRFLPLGHIFFNFCYFCIGMLFMEFQANAQRLKFTLIGPVALVFLGGETLLQMQVAPNPLLGYAVAVAGIGFVAIGCMCLDRFPAQLRWLAWLGASSMTIYLVHILAGSGARIVLAKALHVRDYWLHMAVDTGVGLLLPIAFARAAHALKADFLFRIPPVLSVERRFGTRFAAPSLRPLEKI